MSAVQREAGGPPEALAAALRAMGPGGDIEALRALYAGAYAPWQDAVRRIDDQRYGPHERHLLDVYVPAAGAQGAPVLACLHGGGFIRGDKRAKENAGVFFARHGFVTVVPSYRLAPAARWPSGAEDVAAVWQWMQAHVAGYGGDPSRIVLMGESAGAAHVALATLVRRFHPAGGLKPAGAILASGPYNAGLEGQARRALGVPDDDPRNDAYFGPDRSRWASMSTVDLVDAEPFPLLVTFNELDLMIMQVAAGELYSRLVMRHGFMPEIRMIRHHNHFSGAMSMGTDDSSYSAPLLDFARRCTGG